LPKARNEKMWRAGMKNPSRGMKKAQRRNEMPPRGMKNARVRNEIPPKGNEKCAGQGMKNIESRNEKMWR
jgi:hypothetical protein